MLNSIQNILEQLGFGAQNRTLYVHFSNPVLNSQLFLQRVEGYHRLNEGLKAELICLSTHAAIALKQFVGSQVAVDQVTDSGRLFRCSGIVTGVSQGQSDGALTLYKLTVQDPTALWQHRRNSRVFMNKSTVDVIEIIFKEWQQRSAIFAASLTLDLSGLTKEYDIRPFIMQHNESDAEFIQRLLRQEAINTLIDEAALFVEQPSETIQAQKLRLIDDNGQFTALARRNIRFHRSNATEQQDSMTAFVGIRTLQPTAVHIQRWQPDALDYDEGAGSVLSSHKHSDLYKNETLNLEQAWHMSPAWMRDLEGEDQATPSSNRQVEQINQHLSHHYASQAKQFVAHSSVRDAQVGYWFELRDHPEIDLQHDDDKAFLIHSKSFYNQNNLPKDLNAQVEYLLDQSQWTSTFNSAERQANHLRLQRKNIAVVPTPYTTAQGPVAHAQRAKVVGPSGEEIYVDAWGRVKVRFLFTRHQDQAHDAGAGANDNDTDSAWVDVLTPWAGDGYGARFLPRVGEVVVINFFDGNIDRPYVVGRIHEAQRSPTQFDLKGQLPDTKKLSGVRSREVGGEGSNQLRFDDTTGQISTQLQSSHAASQLNLGNLSHPKETEESDGRGEGFELRTDAWGAVRAGKGMLISTYAQEQAIADHLDAAQAQSLLQQGQESMKMLSSIAVKQQTDALTVIRRLPKFIQSLELKSQSQALDRTVDLFKQGISSDPINALKDCGGFIEDIGKLGGHAERILDEFNQYFSNSQDAVSNLKAFIETVENKGSETIKTQLAAIKEMLTEQPFQALREVGKVLVDVDLSEFDLTAVCGSFGGTNHVGIAPSTALNSLKNFMEGYTSQLEQSHHAKDIEQGKLFRQALMLLASPNGIALTTAEDIILQASQDIAQSAQGSINLSAQKNIVAHAQDKVSIFAAQKGINAFAAKGKIQIQAQDDAIEAIARKVIKLISTEDKIELTSAKEIDLKAGGSQIIVNSRGVFIKTNGKFESKAGQHQFLSGEVVNAELPKMPESGIFSRRFDFTGIFDNEPLLEPIQFKVVNKTKNTQSIGYLDQDARTPRFFGDQEDDVEVELLNSVTVDDKWVVLDDPEQNQAQQINEEECCGAEHDENHDCETTDETNNLINDLESDYLSFGK